MNTASQFYQPSQQLMRLRVGDISSDRSAIVGKKNVIFLYTGTNNYYGHYMSSQSSIKGVEWAELIAKRHQNLSAHAVVLSLFVPNKASCMSDLYPLPLDHSSTPMWRDLKTCLSTHTGVVFSNNLIDASTTLNRETFNPWRLVDSHWSEFGCLMTVNEVLARLAIKPVNCKIEHIDPVINFGDFSSKFHGEVVFEHKSAQYKDDFPQPIRAFDSGSGTPYEGSVGRRVTWTNPDAIVPLHLLIVGNSFAGIGDNPSHLTYWLARVFKKTTFLHAAHMPTNVQDYYRPDIILFQGLERFLVAVPSDDLSAETIESIFNTRSSR